MADGEAMITARSGPRHKPKAHFEKRATAAMEKHCIATESTFLARTKPP